MPGPLNLADRLLEKSEEQSDGCRLWTDAPSGDGYGLLSIGGRRGTKQLAHRLAFTTWVGPIPDGHVVNHMCHERDLNCLGGKTCPHRRCINPEHLEAIPKADNTRRGRTRWTAPSVEHRLRDSRGRFQEVAV